MNVLYIIGGFALLIFGTWQTIVKARNIAKGKQDLLGADIQLLVVGITSIICGIMVIVQHM
jgi:hypothetical protein